MKIAPSAASAQPRGEEEEAVDTISLSVVIPVFAQDRALLASRQALAKLDCVREIIFVLPRTSKPAPIGAQPHGKIVVLRAPLGRASQLNAGAAAARGSHLLFMHHDTEVAPGAVAALAKALTHEPQRAFAFSLHFDSHRRGYRLLSWLAGVRDCYQPFPLGDQGLAVSRYQFFDLGGYPDEPLFEDSVMTWRLRRRVGLRVLRHPARTSAARFEQRGIVRTLLENALLLTLFTLGLSPRFLVRFYYGREYLAHWLDADPRRRRPELHTRAPGSRLARWLGGFLAFVLLFSPAHPAVAVDHTHAQLDTVLQRFVREGRVDYQGLQEQVADPHSAFSRYLSQLAEGSAETEAAWSREQRLAYWINAYNAFTLKLIVDHYPISPRWYMHVLPFLSYWMPRDSILQIDGRWDGITFASVRGEVTLGDIEHEILRPEFGDPRIHFAIVCASVGCPRLQSHAYHPGTITAELDAAAIEFMTTPGQVTWDRDTDSLRISRIFTWFRADFDAPLPPGREQLPAGVAARYGKEDGVVRWLAGYGGAALARRIADGPYRIRYLRYDWRLNEQVVPQTAAVVAVVELPGY